MSPAISQELIDETTALPVARIDGQEEAFVYPMREYLEVNGCRVFVNVKPNTSVAYHIAAGDLHFVKGIFSTAADSAIRRLGVVIGSSLSDAENLADEQTKIVVMDPVHLASVDVVELFSFFFAGTDALLDKRRNRHEPVSLKTAGPVAPDLYAVGAPETSEISIPPLVDSQPPLQEEADAVEIQSVFPDEDRKRIGSIISDVFGPTPDDGTAPSTGKPHKRRRRKIKNGIWAMIVGIVFMGVLPFLWYIGSVSITGGTLVFVGSRLKEGNVLGAARIASVGRYWLYQSTFALGFVGAPFRLAGFTELVRGQERLLSFLTDISGAFDETQKIIQLEKNVASLLLTSQGAKNGVTPAPDIEQLRMSVTSVQNSLGLAQAQLATLLRDAPFPFIFAPVAHMGQRAQTALDSLRGILTYVDQVLTMYPHLAGFREPKTYLVLLQNSNELRPTGGFIGSVGVAKFEEGFLSDFSIQDVYALDGQLKGHVDPPLPIREILGNEHWYLRDSNWDPDFKTSAARAIWFYEKETGGYVDGVIAVNVPVIVDVLTATGPILLSDYNDRITAENFFGKSIFYTQTNSFPGSTQKSDFLGTLARTLMTKITTTKDVNTVSLFRTFAAGLARRDIQFMFTDDTLQQLVDHYGWSGRVFTENGCKGVPPESCLFDPFAVVEANLSVSKVNYFIKRTSTREIVIAPDGGVSENVTVSLRNTVNQTADANARGIGGSFTTYMRFLVPADSLVRDITLDGVPVASRDTRAKGSPPLPYIESTESPANVRSIGVAFAVDPGSERQLRISYKRMTPLPFGRGGGVLDILTYKHPGVSDNVAKTSIRYPIYWVATDESRGSQLGGNPPFVFEGGQLPTFLAKDGELEYNTTILQDQFIRLKFVK